MLKLKHALLASLCLLPLPVTETMAATAGVTAAVNQNAKSTPPGGGVRTVVLGANVVQDETIETDGGGLVQILLADGTTFTVGPNSAITIDRFVYDPNANTAQVSATIGRGVFRFIGGRTSKTEGGVQLNTPVGTVGIRGGMADLNFTGAGQIDLLFGNEVTLNGPNGSDRIFQAGYSIVFGANGLPSVIKTPPGSANFIQQALAGRPGSSGGSSRQPDDGKVAGSGVPGANSDTNPSPTQQIPPPDLRAIELATPKPNDNHQVADQIAGRKTLSGTYHGYSAAVVKRGNIESFYRNILPTPDTNGNGGGVQFNFDPSSRQVSGTIAVSETGNSGKTLEVGFGQGSGGGASDYYSDLVYYANGTAAKLDGNGATGDVSTYVVSVGVGSAISDCDCEFAQIGYWYSALEDEEVEATGTFVVGDVTTASEYDDLINDNIYYGTASYSGIAIGFLTQGGTTTNALGNLYMEYDLVAREGWLEVTDFGSAGKSFGGAIADPGNVTGGFAGNGTVGTNTYGYATGTSYHVDGSFISDGSNKTAGVIGNFDAQNSGWSATGVFAGAQSGAPQDLDRYNNY